MIHVVVIHHAFSTHSQFWWANFSTLKNFIDYYHSMCMCVCVYDTCECRPVCAMVPGGCERAALRRQVLGTKLRLSGFQGKRFYLASHFHLPISKIATMMNVIA